MEETLCETVDLFKGFALCRYATVTAQYAQVVRDVGENARGNIVVLDLWNRIMDLAVPQGCSTASEEELPGARALGVNKCLANMLPDGLHLSVEGYRIFWDELMNTLEKKWPSDGPEMQSYVFPPWREAPRFKGL